MILERIERLMDCGVFREFTWPADLPNFARYNIIYGWNGSGKTTLSRVLRALETKTQPPLGQVALMIGGNKVSNNDFGNATLPLRVFNRDFVAESVFPLNGSDVAPIFVVGKENVEKQKLVTDLKVILDKTQSKLTSSWQQNSSAENSLEQFCRAKAFSIKDALRSSGPNPYNNYDKSNFIRRSQEMVSAGDKVGHVLADTTREKLLVQLRSNQKAKLQLLTYQFPNLEALKQTVTDILSTTVVSAAIQSIKDDAKLSAWVHTGLGIHQELKSNKCLFCEQVLPKERMVALEAHFSTEYEDLLRTLDNHIGTIQATIKAVSDLAVPKCVELNDDLSSEYEMAAAALEIERDSAKQLLNALLNALTTKKPRVFESVPLDVTIPNLNVDVIDNLNAIIVKHNQACEDFNSRRETARRQLEADSVASSLDEFIQLTNTVQTAKSNVQNDQSEIDRLTKEIGELQKDIIEHLKPAEDLNKDLQNYLGHGELRLAVKDTGYTIMRDGTPAVSLSEGEMTAISLLYFLKSLEDRRFDLTKGVVVLDDPVSSLDQNAMFAAFGFIRSKTQSAAQVIILTHNFAFFRQVRNWYHNLKWQNKKKIELRPARFYMLNCAYDQNQRCSSIVPLDKLLEEFDSDYHYLFAFVYRTAMATPQTNIEQNYALPNIARRLLESFLAFKQPQISDELGKKLELLQFDESKKIRIIRFLHTHSHGIALGDPSHDLSLLSEAQAILKDLLVLMQSQDAGHFSAMVAMVAKSNAADEDDENN